MADLHVLYNPGDTSVVVDAAGHTLDGLQKIEGNPNGVIFSRLIATGQLTDLGPAAEQPEAEEVLIDDDAPTDETGD